MPCALRPALRKHRRSQTPARKGSPRRVRAPIAWQRHAASQQHRAGKGRAQRQAASAKRADFVRGAVRRWTERRSVREKQHGAADRMTTSNAQTATRTHPAKDSQRSLGGEGELSETRPKQRSGHLTRQRGQGRQEGAQTGKQRRRTKGIRTRAGRHRTVRFAVRRAEAIEGQPGQNAARKIKWQA
ncbi:hypothetical protein ERJ75_001471900 [Trypanosoma vivax]|nr:hypothetical protein ERJ75_001471900 [Trypanosoma vivax]